MVTKFTVVFNSHPLSCQVLRLLFLTKLFNDLFSWSFYQALPAALFPLKHVITIQVHGLFIISLTLSFIILLTVTIIITIIRYYNFVIESVTIIFIIK